MVTNLGYDTLLRDRTEALDAHRPSRSLGELIWVPRAPQEDHELRATW